MLLCHATSNVMKKLLRSFWSYSLGGLVANQIDPAAFNAARFLVAAIVISVMGIATGSLDRRLLLAPWRFVVLGVFFATFFVSMFEGLKTANPVSSAAILTLGPIVSGIFGWVLLRQITTPRMALALAIGAVGAAWVIFRADLSALLAFRIGSGEVTLFWGMVAYSIFTPLARLLNRGESPITMTLGTLSAGCLLIVLYGWASIWATEWGNLSNIVWITLAYTAVFSGAFTILLQQYATMRLPAAKVMAYIYLTPTWVILWELALGHGAPRGLVMAGVGLTIVALLLLLKEDA